MTDWQPSRAMKPSSAVKIYGPINGGRANLRNIIAECIREGVIKVRAAHVWESSHSSILKAWQEEPDKDKYPVPKAYTKEHTVHRSVWYRSKTWADDIMGWDFSRNRMYVTRSQNPTKRIMMRDVRFSTRTVKQALLDPKLKKKVGSLQDLSKGPSWRLFWYEVVRLAAMPRGEVKNSGLADFANNQDLFEHIINAIRLRHGSIPNETPEDVLISGVIKSGLKFDIANNAIFEEIKFLRTNLGVTDRHTQGKRRG